MIVFYASSLPRVYSLVPLFLESKKRGVDSILVLSLNIDPEHVSFVESLVEDNVFHMSKHEVAMLSNATVLFSDESTEMLAPQGAIRVSLWHSLPDKTLSPIYHQMIKVKPNIYLDTDYLMVPNYQSDSAFQGGLFDSHPRTFLPEMFRCNNKELTVIPAGYPKIEYLKGFVNSREGMVTYAPTRLDINGSSSRHDAVKIITALLSIRSVESLYIRPYPTDYDFFDSLIANNFSTVDSRKLVLDSSPLSIKCQTESSIVVTDKSSYALTFALATNRPIVEVNLSGSYDEDERQIDVGYSVTTVKGLVNSIEECLNKSGDWAGIIPRFGQAFLNNPDNAVSYIVQSLLTILSGSKQDEWVSAVRTHATSSSEGISFATRSMKKNHVDRVKTIYEQRLNLEEKKGAHL